MRTATYWHFFETALIGSLLALDCARGQVFTLDTNLSSVTISGSVAGGTITPQAAGSLTGKIGGNLQVALTGSTIQFIGGSQIMSETNGSWQPLADGSAGSAPADFGGAASLGIASGVAALRNILLDVVSPAINLSGGNFDSTNLTFLFPTNATSSLAYNVSGLLSKKGTLALTGYATNKVTALSSLTTTGGQQTLTIPVDATFYFTLLSANDTAIRLQGQLVATRAAVVPLTVGSIALLSGSAVLEWTGSPGATFLIESSTGLGGTWVTNATIVTPSSGTYTWTGAVSGPLRFFRLAK